MENYSVFQKLGEGSFGKIFLIRGMKSGVEFAMKVEDRKNKHSKLVKEYKFYSILNEEKEALCNGVPLVYHLGKEIGYRYMIMDLMGLSIEELFKRCNKHFSIKTVLMIAIQTLISIKFVHSKGILHRDLKPHNFVMGLMNQSHRVFLIDFGLSKKFMAKGKIVPYAENKGMTGTMRYASIRNQQGCEQGRRDDLETLAYSFIYLLKGSLPWQNFEREKKEEKFKKILDSKIQTKTEDLCSELPKVFSSFLEYSRVLLYEETPNYNFWIQSFYDQLNAPPENNQFDYVYDWTSVVQHTATLPCMVVVPPKTQEPANNNNKKEIENEESKQSLVESKEPKKEMEMEKLSLVLAYQIPFLGQSPWMFTYMSQPVVFARW